MAATYIRRSLKSHPSLPMAMYKNAWDVMRVSSYPATDVAELLSVYSSALTLSGTTPGPQSIHVAHRKAQAAVFRDPTSLNAWAALAGGLLHTALSSACVDTLREDSSVRHGYTVKLNLALHLCDYVRVRSKDMEADLIARSANAPAVQIRTQAAQLIATTRWASLAMCECLLLLGEAETSPTSHTEDKDTPTDAKEPNAYLDMAMGLAVESLNGYQADDTGRVVWLHLLARLHAIRCKTGDVELAIRHLRTAISASVEPSALWLSLGDLLSSVGKTQGSRLCMQQAAAAAESVGLGSTMQLVSLIRLTWLNLLTGHTTEAEESLRQASDLDAHAVPLTFFKGVLSVMKKDNRQARRAFTKLLSTSETQSDWHGLAISLNDMYGKQA
ncbi:hypothetical protein SARC_00037 [Sphaeroforma arctica JP610]|uniref:Uncharacterized protein n=1 Tax=Sphaeroforma arctica JP610 TaxID=667725 RepID=A0A0L0GFZ6_9EUKA|nr:hypothetical protein SARC_00037 [Sphaeroforma arctica JP610]KNC87779.1 hypothetical protein SARC_00037 [Sphaeroforma arctica JP610]|eukprot:XP_014161681.1 hypothetical protein SARC_00037 [Sphaeroforma arctica JP610]